MQIRVEIVIRDDEVISNIFRVIEAVNNKNIKQFRKSECVPRRTSHVRMALGHEIYDHDSSARSSVRDDRESQSSCTNLTELVSGKYGERPVDAARVTEGQRDPRTLSRRKKKSHTISRRNLSYTDSVSRFTELYNTFRLKTRRSFRSN